MGTDIHGKLRYRDWNDSYSTVDLPPYFNDRDYDFFAILADVRNDYGFASTSRYTKPVEPITSDRGLPLNVSNENWDYGDHSFGYVTYDDLKNTVLHNQTITRTGFVVLSHYLSLEGENPSYWCGDVSGPDITKITESAYLNNPGNYTDEYNTYIQMEWNDKPFQEKINNLITWMSFYHQWHHNQPEDLIFIFGFDS